MMHSFTEEKSMLITVIEEARSTISDLQDDLRQQEQAVLDLSQQLASSHVSREEASKHAARTIESLHGAGQKLFQVGSEGFDDERKDGGGPDEY